MIHASEARQASARAIVKRMGEGILVTIEQQISESYERGGMRVSVFVDDALALDITHALRWYGYSTEYLGRQSDGNCLLSIEWGEK